MIELFGILWLRPWWLALLPVAAGLAWALRHRAGRLGAWEQAVDPHLMRAMRRQGRVASDRGGRSLLPPALLALLALALAGPAVERRNQPAFRNLDAVLLVIDLSPSIVESGRFTDMLTAARLIVAEAGRGARQAGAVVYAGDAYLASALTTDTRALGGMIALLTAETLPDPGSRPARGLDLAAELLQEAQILSGDVVLLSDGGGLDPETTARARSLAESGRALSTLHIGIGQNPALEALAEAGGGAFGDLADPGAVLAQLSDRRATRLAESGYEQLVTQDLGRWVLLLALLPALLLLPGREDAK
ncbi:MAG: vWA domain-containing protein [Pseudomonadota bacterium]